MIKGSVCRLLLVGISIGLLCDIQLIWGAGKPAVVIVENEKEHYVEQEEEGAFLFGGATTFLSTDDDKGSYTNSNLNATAGNNIIRSSNNLTAGKQRLLQVLEQTNTQVDDESLAKLPTWDQIEELYGEAGPVIIGLETCQEFREKVPAANRIAAPAGLWNTGTNALSTALARNCRIPNQTHATIEWQVPWGKHMPASVKFTNHSSPKQARINKDNVLPVVIVKDPFNWFQSMCKNPYRVQWFHGAGHCPNLVPNNPKEQEKAKPYYAQNSNNTSINITHSMEVSVKFPLEWQTKQTWKSLAHLWSDWNGEYFHNTHYPRLMIRYEDLLFRGKETVSAVCTCIGGQLKNNGQHKYQAAQAKVHGGRQTSDLLQAFIKYGNASHRLHGMTQEDMALARQDGLDPEMVKSFHYSV